MRQALHHRQFLPSLMILMFLFAQSLVDLLTNLVDLILNHKIRQTSLDFHHDYPPAPPPAAGERTRAVDQSRERSRPRSPVPEPQLSHIPMSDGDEDQPPQSGRQRQQSRSRERSYPHAQVPQGPQVQPVIIHEPATDPDQDPTVVNPSSSTGLSPPVEQRDRSRRQQRSRSRERTPQRTPPHTPSQSGQQPNMLYLLLENLRFSLEHWTVTPETHKYAAAAGSFCFVTTANGEKQDICNLTTFPSVQRSLCLEEVTDDSSSTRVELPNGADNQTRDMLERCMATCGKAAGTRAKTRSRARKEASAHEVRGYYKQFARAKTPRMEILD